MFDLSNLAAFVVIVLGLFLIPGPAVLLVLTRTVQGGRKTGILTGLGIAAGDFIHTLCAAVGLSALLMTSSTAFTIVKLAGAGYLIYIGLRAFFANTGGTASRQPSQPVSPLQAFLQAIPAEVLNPKTALFFLAFLPQFVHTDKGPALPQFLVLGLIFVVLSALYTTAIVMLIKPIGRLTKRLTWLERWQGKIVGSIFITLGLKVATQQR
ncbi:LysE family translocator [Duganella levis]|uniref:LysE family transporter n=1 Tax=Duganella levis TaxID=2692169 RepID=A0ABW9W4F0_9BURK|nr:LysE family translocator [Duganella levis]MYN28632.1 LysE family transporter [Duganella levis]